MQAAGHGDMTADGIAGERGRGRGSGLFTLHPFRVSCRTAAPGAASGHLMASRSSGGEPVT
ncbi:hypothetical protein TPA0906_55850 [Streptomyces olivaceus]|nr:hypothetical protein TPA0906_55850 [Streptomyces olivaceus]